VHVSNEYIDLVILFLIIGDRLLDLRRDTYEDYYFPLKAVSNDSYTAQTFDLHSLQNYAKYYGNN
jgi:hypothetical protein